MTQATLRLALLLSLMSGAAGLQGQSNPVPSRDPKIPRDPPIYFYDSRLDGIGQKAETAAGQVANAQVFETQLQNLDAVSKLATDRIFTSGRRVALARLEAARQWGTLYSHVKIARDKALPTDSEKAEWAKKIEELKAQIAATEIQADQAGASLKSIADLLEEIGSAKEVIQFGTFLATRNVADITKTDLRVVGKVQETLFNLGNILQDLASQPVPASSRPAAQQMKIDLKKAEIDHLKALIKIEDRRMAGQQDVKSLVTAIENTLSCEHAPGDPVDTYRNCTFKFSDDDGNDLPADRVLGSEGIEATLSRYKQDAAQDSNRLKAALYLLENFAALSARAETPVRLAELRSAIEERRFAIRRDAVMARAYEQIFLIGAQRIAIYYKGGIKPETLAQFLQAASTAGIIPSIVFK